MPDTDQYLDVPHGPSVHADARPQPMATGQTAAASPEFDPASLVTRSMPVAMRRALSGFLKSVEAVSTSHAAYHGARAWRHLPRDRRRATRTVDPGTRQRIRWSQRSVLTESWGSDGPVVLLVHGWVGHRRQMDPFVEPLVGAGYRVVSMDLPSHGDSQDPGVITGGQWTPAAFVAAISAVAAAVGPVEAVVAHSLGAVSTALAITEGTLSTNQVVFVSVAPLRPLEQVEWFGRAMGLREETVAMMPAKMARYLGRPLTDFHVDDRLAATPGLPSALLVHDRDDADTPVPHAKHVQALWPGAELHLTDGLGHRRILRDPAVVELVVARIDAVARERAQAGRS